VRRDDQIELLLPEPARHAGDAADPALRPALVVHQHRVHVGMSVDQRDRLRTHQHGQPAHGRAAP
jgi:hypothetical protein